MNSADDSSHTTPARCRRSRLTSLLGAAALAGLAALAGCGSSAPPAASGSTATPAATATSASATASGGAPVGSATATPAASSTPPSSTTAPSAQPVLGRLAGVFANGSGFGQARPAEIFNGGDPTGLVTKITWQSWGGATATGTGTSTYVAANQSVAAGTQQTATVVAFDLGTCNGVYMYQAVEWYFPQHGQSFNSAQYENVCTGTYVGQ